MAIDIVKGSHVVSFPSKIASAMGQFGHVYNIVTTADVDNGALCGRGDYVSFDQYEQAAVANGFAGRINEQAADGSWYIEVTALPDDEVLYMYNAPVSEYEERELQDESLFYNKSGDVVQGMTLRVGDVFSVSENGITGTPAANTAVTYSAGKYVI